MCSQLGYGLLPFIFFPKILFYISLSIFTRKKALKPRSLLPYYCLDLTIITYYQPQALPEGGLAADTLCRTTDLFDKMDFSFSSQKSYALNMTVWKELKIIYEPSQLSMNTKIGQICHKLISKLSNHKLFLSFLISAELK